MIDESMKMEMQGEKIFFFFFYRNVIRDLPLAFRSLVLFVFPLLIELFALENEAANVPSRDKSS